MLSSGCTLIVFRLEMVFYMLKKETDFLVFVRGYATPPVFSLSAEPSIPREQRSKTIALLTKGRGYETNSQARNAVFSCGAPELLSGLGTG